MLLFMSATTECDTIDEWMAVSTLHSQNDYIYLYLIYFTIKLHQREFFYV